MQTLNAQMIGPKRGRLDLYGDFGPRQLDMIDVSAVSAKLQELGDVDTLEIHVNSRGGSAYEGLAIANVLKAHPAQNKIGVVDGIAASAATLPLMVCGTVRIPESATMMIHEPIIVVAGGEKEISAGIAQLGAIKQAAISLYAAKSGKSVAELTAMLAAETWLVGQQAVDAGFADETAAGMTAANTYSRNDVSLFLRQLSGASMAANALADPANAKYQAEYLRNPHLQARMTEADYIASRRCDDKLDSLTSVEMLAPPRAASPAAGLPRMANPLVNPNVLHGVGSEQW